MTHQLKLPSTPLFRIFYWIIIFGLIMYLSFLKPWPKMPSETETVKEPLLKTSMTENIDIAWINKALPYLDYLLAPISPLPCPTGISNIDGKYDWLPVLTRIILYAQRDQNQLALQMSNKYINIKQGMINNLRRNRGTYDNNTRLAMVHLLYMDALLRLKTGYYGGGLLWNSLKYPIRIYKLLLKRDSFGIEGKGITSKQFIPTLGCSSYVGNELTTYALYNNLIVGYLKAKNFYAPQKLKKECKRPYTSQALDKNPLFSVMEKLCPPNNVVEEYRVWAISNAERLLAENPNPPDLLLSFNLMLLIDSIIKRHEQSGQEVKNALLKKRDEMISLSLKNRDSAPKEYKIIFADNIKNAAIKLENKNNTGFTLGWRLQGDWINLIINWFIYIFYDIFIIKFGIVLLAWILFRWIEIQLCERKALFTSFYQLEAAQNPARRRRSYEHKIG